MDNFVVGPYFFYGLPELLENVSDNMKRTMLYEHGCAPCHYAENKGILF